MNVRDLDAGAGNWRMHVFTWTFHWKQFLKRVFPSPVWMLQYTQQKHERLVWNFKAGLNIYMFWAFANICH